jgi:hypothetical protein
MEAKMMLPNGKEAAMSEYVWAIEEIVALVQKEDVVLMTSWLSALGSILWRMSLFVALCIPWLVAVQTFFHALRTSRESAWASLQNPWWWVEFLGSWLVIGLFYLIKWRSYQAESRRRRISN